MFEIYIYEIKQVNIIRSDRKKEVAMKGFRMGVVRLTLALCASLLAVASVLAASSIGWGSGVLINNIPTFTDAGTDARGLHPGTFGSEYGRMLKLANGSWL